MSKSYWGLRNSAKKAISLAVSLSTALTMSGIAYFAIPVQVASAASCTAHTFSKNLQLGSRGTDVQNLQTSLNCLQNAGLPGTTYFGALTKAAVAAYQKAKGITPAVGYFGPKTRAAVNADLAGGAAPTTGATSSNAALIALIQQLLPAGAQRDAIIAALQATSVATTATTATTTATTTAGLGPQLAAPATGLAVSLAAATPPAGTSLVAGGGQMPVLTLALTAGTDSTYTVTGITLTKTGVVSDSSINNLYLFHHYTNQFVAQYQSLSSGRATFTGMNLVFQPGQTRYLDLKVDLPSSGLNAGNTVAFQLASASDINTVNAAGTLITETGNFPIQGNSMTVTVVSNPNIASIAPTTSYNGPGTAAVYAGTTGYLAGSINLVISNNAVKLSRMVWTETGSITASTDLKNLKLYVNGAQVGSTVAGLNSDGTVSFDLSANPVSLPTGSNNVQVYTDVVGGPNRNFTMQILHNYDVTLTDSVYSTTITFTTPASNGSGSSCSSSCITLVQVQPATPVVSIDANTPTGNVAKGATGVVLAKFDVKASGENMKILFVPFTINFAGTAPINSNLTGYIKNVQLVDDQGNQVGTTISNPPSATGSTFSSGSATGPSGMSGSLYSDSFGSPTANINYVIPANVTRVWSLKADIQSTASSTTTGLTAALVTGNGAVQGLVSNQTNTLGASSGSALTIATTPFTVGLNTSFGSPTYVTNQTAAKIGSFTLGASSAEGVNVSSLTFTTVSNSNVPTTLQNLRVYVSGTQWAGAVTYPSVASNTAYPFTGSSPVVIPAGQTVTIDIYADLLSNAATAGAGPTSLTAATANGAVTNVSETFPGSVTGQSVTVGLAGTLAVTTGTTLPAAQVVQGSTGNVLGSWTLSAGPNENVKVTSLTVWDQVTSTSTVPQTFQNLSLYSGGTLSGNTLSGGSLLTGGQVLGTGVSSTITYYPVTFSFPTASPLLVPANGSISLFLTGDVPAYSQATAASAGTSHTFLISTTTAPVAQGASSNTAIVPSIPANATNSAVTVVPLRLAISSFALYPGATYGSKGSVNIPLASLTLSASGASTSNYGVLKQLKVVLGGAGIPASGIATTTENFYVYDSNNNQLVSTSWTAGGTVATSTPTLTLNLATSTPANGTVYVGTPRTYYLYGDTVNFTAPSSGNTNPTISIQITGGTSLTSATFVTQPNYTDSYNLDNLSPNAPFPKSVSVTYQ